MSLISRGINGWLRLVEKPKMARAKGAEALRRNLEWQAKYLFYPPRGTSQSWETLTFEGVSLPILRITPQIAQPKRTILYIHGGGFVFGSPRTHAAMAAQLAARVGAEVILPQYRLAPEAQFPAATDDIHAVWDALIAQGRDPKDIVIGGDSAGGALAFGLLGALCKAQRPMPGAVFGFSPLADMAFQGESFVKNAKCEAVLAAERAHDLAKMYLGAHPTDDPIVSPIYADFTNAPPIWLTVGDTEILLDDSRRLAARLRKFNVPVSYQEEHDLPHVWPVMHNILPEGRRTLDTLAQWIRQEQGWADEN